MVSVQTKVDAQGEVCSPATSAQAYFTEGARSDKGETAWDLQMRLRIRDGDASDPEDREVGN